MKTLLLMLALCGTMLAADKPFMVFGEGLTYGELIVAQTKQNLLPTPEYLAAVAKDSQPKAVSKQPPSSVQLDTKARQERSRLASDFHRVSSKLTADEVKAVQAIVAKHKTSKPAAPAAKPAKKK